MMSEKFGNCTPLQGLPFKIRQWPSAQSQASLGSVDFCLQARPPGPSRCPHFLGYCRRGILESKEKERSEVDLWVDFPPCWPAPLHERLPAFASLATSIVNGGSLPSEGLQQCIHSHLVTSSTFPCWKRLVLTSWRIQVRRHLK